MIHLYACTPNGYVLANYYFPANRQGLQKAREKRVELLSKYLDAEIHAELINKER